MKNRFILLRFKRNCCIKQHRAKILLTLSGTEYQQDRQTPRIKALPMKLIDRIDEELLLTAASLKARYPISYADSFAGALAMIKNCPLLTGDPEFRSLEKQGIIRIEWLNP